MVCCCFYVCIGLFNWLVVFVFICFLFCLGVHYIFWRSGVGFLPNVSMFWWMVCLIVRFLSGICGWFAWGDVYCCICPLLILFVDIFCFCLFRVFLSGYWNLWFYFDIRLFIYLIVVYFSWFFCLSCVSVKRRRGPTFQPQWLSRGWR